MNSRSAGERNPAHHVAVSTSIVVISFWGSGMSPKKAASQLPMTKAQSSSRTPASASAGCGADRNVSEADDLVDVLALELGKHSLERRAVAVDVRDQADAHAADSL